MRVQLRDEEPTERAVRVERIGGVPRRVFAGTALVVAVIVVALIKPWGEPSGRVPPPPPVALHPTPIVTPVAQATATADPEVIAAEAGALCFAVPTWRLITMETSELGDTRTMYATRAVAAAGPDDRAIPPTDITATKLIAIGVCRPSSPRDLGGGSPAPEFDAHIWALGSDGQPVREATSVLDANLFAFGEAYYAPASVATWAAGRYSVEIPNGAGSGESLWFAVDFATHALS